MWLLPTRRRPHLLKKMVESAKNTDASTPCMVLIGMKDYFDSQAAYREIENILPASWKIHQTEEVEFGTKVREVWPLVMREQWVGLLNDDFFFVTKEWDKMLVSRLDGKNFTSSNDRWMAPQKAATATAVSMGLINAMGFPIFPPGVRHLFVDDALETIGRATGCWRICMDVIVEHHHQLKGHGQPGGDSTHQRVYNDMNFLAEKTVYEHWRDNGGLAATIERIKKFQNYIPGEQYNPKVSAAAPIPMPVVV